MKNEIKNKLNRVNLSYKKTVTYHKDGQFLTKFEPEVIKSWLKEVVESVDYHEDIESSIDSVIDEHDRLEWSETKTSYEQCGFDHQLTTDYFGEGSFDKSIQMWIDKKKIESLTQQVKSLTQKLESSTS